MFDFIFLVLFHNALMHIECLCHMQSMLIIDYKQGSTKMWKYYIFHIYLKSFGLFLSFQIFVWSMKTGRLLDVLSGHGGPVHGLMFSPINVS